MFALPCCLYMQPWVVPKPAMPPVSHITSHTSPPPFTHLPSGGSLLQLRMWAATVQRVREGLKFSVQNREPKDQHRQGSAPVTCSHAFPRPCMAWLIVGSIYHALHLHGLLRPSAHPPPSPAPHTRSLTSHVPSCHLNFTPARCHFCLLMPLHAPLPPCPTPQLRSCSCWLHPPTHTPRLYLVKSRGLNTLPPARLGCVHHWPSCVQSAAGPTGAPQ